MLCYVNSLFFFVVKLYLGAVGLVADVADGGRAAEAFFKVFIKVWSFSTVEGCPTLVFSLNQFYILYIYPFSETFSYRKLYR